MSSKRYRCVNCGQPTAALYKNYGPSVLKLSKCEHCRGIVDKYIEYDPVIVMIDLVLISKEAQRHVLYNTEFKFFWKVLILVTLLETFGVWSGDSLFSVAVYSLCHINTNETHHAYLELPYWMPQWAGLRDTCRHWVPSTPPRAPGFIWEKEFYIHFMATAAGLGVFIAVIHWSLSIVSIFFNREPVGLAVSVQAASVGGSFAVLAAPALLWGRAWPAAPALTHGIVLAYTVSAHASLLQVLYGCGWLISIMVLLLGSGLRLLTIYYSMPTLINLFIAIQ